MQLFNKLPCYGLPPQLCERTSNFLSGRSEQVLVDGYASSFHKIKNGIPQGSALALTLFAVLPVLGADLIHEKLSKLKQLGKLADVKICFSKNR